MLTDQHYLDYVERLIHLTSEEFERYIESPTAAWKDFGDWFAQPEKRELLDNYMLEKIKEMQSASDTAEDSEPVKRRRFGCIRSRSRKLADYID